MGRDGDAAAILSGGRFSIETVPDPVPAADTVVLEVAACGVCGIDHTFYRARLLPDGATLGHEFAGTVAAVGRGVDGWKVGAPAAVVPIPYCGHCMASDHIHEERAGLPLTPEARAQLRAFMTEHARGRHGQVGYELRADFGLEPADVRRRFAFSFERFPACAED